LIHCHSRPFGRPPKIAAIIVSPKNGDGKQAEPEPLPHGKSGNESIGFPGALRPKELAD
jgi:hypothetical protein